MRNRFVLTCLSLFLSVPGLYAQYKKSDFSALYGLKGTWKMSTGRGILHEVWRQENDTLMQSSGFRVKDRDTVREESVSLAFSKGMITYVPVVSGQNEGKPVIFPLVLIDGRKFIFENKEHDFPQRITYEINDTSLDVKISGTTKKGFREIPFHFVKE